MNLPKPEFFIRQSTLPNIGKHGIAKLRSSTLAIAGVGGVGSSAAYYLARSGIGTIRLIDQDIVEPSNLQRIQSATRQDLYRPKAEVLSRRLTEFDSSATFDAIVDTITSRNAEELLKGVDLVLDGLDNFRTRYVLNKFSISRQVPYLFAGAVGSQAHIALLNPPRTPCLECIMPHVIDRINDSCETLGVSPTITGLTGSIAAETAIRTLLAEPTRLATQLMTIDMAGPDVLFSQLLKRDGCPACQIDSDSMTYDLSSITLLCGEHTANILPPANTHLDLHSLSARIPAETVLQESESVLVYQRGQNMISIFQNGRILVSGVSGELEATNLGRQLWEEVIKGRDQLARASS